jgi:hypothetical protein
VATTSDIRNASRFEVLRGVYAAGAITRQALAEAGPLSLATVSNVVAELLEAGVLPETAYETYIGVPVGVLNGRDGRPPAAAVSAVN